MSTFTYFAYGSNMLDERLRQRCSSARFVGTGAAAGWQLAFTKRSLDHSGKATMRPCSSSTGRVHGVLFTIDLIERPILDLAEGADYERRDNVPIEVEGGALTYASAYIARETAIDAGLIPYDWYRALVIAGARRHRLPADVIAMIEAVPVRPDPVLTREHRRVAIALLVETGYGHLVSGT